MIKIADNITWAEGDMNLGARAWIAEEIGKVEPTKDAFGRPEVWVVETPTATVEMRRIYIRPGAWAKKSDEITVKAKDNGEGI